MFKDFTILQETGVWFDGSKKNPEKWVVGLGLPSVERAKPPEPDGCLILEYLQTLDITTKKKLEVWTQYRLCLSFLGGYFSSFKKSLRQTEVCKKFWNQEKSWEITGLKKFRSCLVSHSVNNHQLVLETTCLGPISYNCWTEQICVWLPAKRSHHKIIILWLVVYLKNSC